MPLLLESFPMLTRPAIESLIAQGYIEVAPAPSKIGPNSIDLRLGDELKTYHPTEGRIEVRDPVSGSVYLALDPRNPPPLVDVPKHGDGYWLLVPGRFYLGVTHESTKTIGVVPHLDGRSTCGRLSIEAHKTAGVGDNGFHGNWTLEIECTEPVIVRPLDRLFQVYFSPAIGSKGLRDLRLDKETLYCQDNGHHYNLSEGVKPASPLDQK